MTVGFLTYDVHKTPDGVVPGGCAFYRCLLPMTVVGGRLGLPAWDPMQGFGVWVDEDHAAYGYDTVMLKLLMASSIPAQIEQAKALGQRVVIDVDDHYEAIPDGNIAKAETAKHRTHNREHYLKSILMADTITVSTPFLLNHYGKQHPDVRLIRNGVLLPMFRQRKPANRKPTIGWVGSVPWKADDLEPLREWLPGFLEDNDLMFHHSGHVDGHPSFADVTGVNPDRVTTLPLVTLDAYHLLFDPIDIGIVPLTVNDFNAAKSNIKGLEYAANGIPFIAAGTPEYRLLEESGVGATASTVDQWVGGLTALLDYKVRRKAAAVNLSVVEKKWTIGARADEWKAALT